MSTSKDYSEAELLAYFDRICSCDIDAEALAELQMVLRTQPDAPAMFLQYMSMHADMYGAVRLSRVRKIFESEVQLRVDATPTLRTHAKRWGTRLVPILAIAAAVLLLLWPTGPPQAEPILNWPDAVATLNRVEGVVWSETGSQYDVTSILTSGNSLQFLSGLVELELRQGAVVVLEGPAHLVVDDVNRATLLDGKLAAVVPPWAKGFRVDTPGIDVVDHGTRFSMSVSSAAAGEPEVKVLVAEGEVELLEADQPHQNRRLFAGEGVRVNHGVLTQHNHDEAATHLVEKLPGNDGKRDAVIVGDRWRELAAGRSGPATS